MHRFGLIFAALLLVPAANAETFYIGASIGVSMIDDVASTNLTSVSQPGELPGQVSINGSAFDSSEPAYGIALGWRAKNWLALELGYTDLGKSKQTLRGPALSSITPSVNLISFPPGSGFTGFVPTPLSFDGPALSIEEWSLGARFSAPLVSDLSANWSVAITHVQFDASGELIINEIVTLDPLVLNSVNIPYASPDNEIGYKFGFGFAWKFNDRFSTDIGYRRHDTKVVDVESVSLQLILSF